MARETSTRFAYTLALAVSLAVVVSAWAANVVIIEDWTRRPLGAQGIPDGWTSGQSWGFPKYDFTIMENSSHRVLHLRSEGDSSMMSKDMKGKIDLKKTPILEWRWKVVTLPAGGDSRSKHTDDQAAQLYVVWPRFPQEFRSRIIGYIWDTRAPAGLVVKSEKTSTVTYIVVRSGPAELGKWLTERRNLAADYRKIYREAPDNPGAISIAIDSDDTNSSSESFFGAIAFKKS